MGRASIVSAEGDGLYIAVPKYDDEHGGRLLQALQDTIAEHDAKIIALEAETSAAQVDRDNAQAALAAYADLYIAALRADPTTADRGPMNAAQASLIAAQGILNDAQRRLSFERAARLEAEKRKAMLEAESNPVASPMWCADYAVSISGDPPTIEIPGEVGAVIIRPQYQPGEPPAWSGERDGLLMPRPWQTPEQAFWNAAMLPGWQRHMPTYRAGRISNIDRKADTATVTLDAARSTAQDLNINADAVFQNVPVRYMTCNASAFQDDDHVVVEFNGRQWASPVVIGFVSHPRPCDVTGGYYVLPADDTAPAGWPVEGEAGALIALRGPGEAPLIRANVPTQAGPVATYAAEDVVITFDHGQGANRYGLSLPDTTPATAGQAKIWIFGSMITTPGPVVGAGAFGDFLLVLVAAAGGVTVHHAPSPIDALRDQFKGQNIDPETVLTWTSLPGLIVPPAGRTFHQAWVFHPAGMEAQTVVQTTDAAQAAIRTKLQFTLDPDTGLPVVTRTDIPYTATPLRFEGGTMGMSEHVEFAGYDIGPWVTSWSDAQAYDSVRAGWPESYAIESLDMPEAGDISEALIYEGYPWAQPMPWPTRVRRIYYPRDMENGSVPIANNAYGASVETRKAWMRFKRRNVLSGQRISVVGSELIAVEYDQTGAERLIELRAVQGEDAISMEFVERIDELAAVVRSDSLDSTAYATAWLNGIGAPPRPNGASPPNSFYSVQAYQERKETGVELAGKLTVGLFAGDTPLALSSVGDIPQMSMAAVEASIAAVVPDPPGLQSSSRSISYGSVAPVQNPFTTQGEALIALDGRNLGALVQRDLLAGQVSHFYPVGSPLPRVTVTGTLSSSRAVRWKGSLYEGTSLQAETPASAPAALGGDFDGVTELSMQQFVDRLVANTIRGTLVAGVGSSPTKHYVRAAEFAFDQFACRNPFGYVVSMQSPELTPVEVVAAVVDNAPYDAETAIDPPSSANFRLRPVRVV